MALPRVFTIPASVPFVPTLIDALSSGRLVEGFTAGVDPLAFAGATLYLPTRRACRLVRDSFLDLLERDAAILPRIVAIGDVDEDEIAFASMAAGELAAEALALPDGLGGLERRMLLAHLVRRWAAAPEVRTATGSAAGRQFARRGARARRRSGAAHGRHGDAAGAVGPARRTGAGRRSTNTGS